MEQVSSDQRLALDQRRLAPARPEPSRPEPSKVERDGVPTVKDRLEQSLTRLERHDPQLSAKTGVWLWQRLWLSSFATGSLVTMLTAPGAVVLGGQVVLAVAFATLLAVRVLAINHALRHRPPQPAIRPLARVPDETLPVYTVLIALHAEVPVVPQLVASLRALDYPHDKLDIIFALEADDEPTHVALLGQGLPACMRIVMVPGGLPRTKPRALCYGLSFAHGDYLVVYDAEDLPERDQLRRALAVFDASGPGLGCVQASLAINNADQSWLAAQFAVEYAALFDAILPALAERGLPLPLGGTSNHFRRAVLEAVGGWDPYNVTEDADLGFRLARAGWRVDVVASTTWEEAPIAARSWFNQRTRWQKGWLQTYFVHMRDPFKLWRDLGPGAWLWFQIILGGGLLSALAHPWFYGFLIADWINGTLFPGLDQGPSAWLWWLGLANLTGASVTTIALALITLKRRNRPDLIAHAVMSPLYWLPVSMAAYWAIYDWIKAPFYWAKTPHMGLGLQPEHQVGDETPG